MVEVKSSYEVERGKPLPTYLHSRCQTNINLQLELHYGSIYDILPEIDIKIDDWKVTPDIGIYPLQKVDFHHDILFMTTPPICAIEILTYPQTLSQLLQKSEHYFLKGTKSYWLVIPEFENIYVYEQPFNYTIFRKTEILKDNNLNIELDLSKIFK